MCALSSARTFGEVGVCASVCAGQVNLRRGEGVRCADVVLEAMMRLGTVFVDIFTKRLVWMRDTLYLVPRMKMRQETEHAMSYLSRCLQLRGW